MKSAPLARWLARLAVVALTIAGAASAADVSVMISAGFFGVYSGLGPAFERASGHRLLTTRGPSMGDSREAIPARLARGEAADVVIMRSASIEASASAWVTSTIGIFRSRRNVANSSYSFSRVT